jgi:hypothetical protein
MEMTNYLGLDIRCYSNGGALAERLWLDIQLHFLRLLNLSGFARYKANAASRTCTIEQPGSHFRFEPLCEIRTSMSVLSVSDYDTL